MPGMCRCAVSAVRSPSLRERGTMFFWESIRLNRRSFITGMSAIAAGSVLPVSARAAISTPFTYDLEPPMTERAAFVEWMANNRGEDRNFLGQRWDRLQAMIEHKDVWDDVVKRAFLLTPARGLRAESQSLPFL